MARVLVLTDRHPTDTEWKGHTTWDVILGLAESQHEVRVLMPSNEEVPEITHSRLTIGQPAPSWRVEHLNSWIHAILQYEPDILHTMAVRKTAWTGWTIWPYLGSFLHLFPKIRRLSLLFDHEDFRALRSWHLGSERWIVYSDITIDDRFTGRIDRAPIEVENTSPSSERLPELLIPEPISEWNEPIVSLYMLNDFLERHRELTVRILGGWGEWSLLERRRGWSILAPTMNRIHMEPEVTWPEFESLLRTRRGLYTRCLENQRWRTLLSQHAAEQMGLEIHGLSLPLLNGSTANFLSRVYSAP